MSLDVEAILAAGLRPTTNATGPLPRPRRLGLAVASWLGGVATGVAVTFLGLWLAADRRLATAEVPAPRPALRYRLLPAEEDLVDGNAAIHYLKAMEFLGWSGIHKRIDELWSKAEEEAAREGRPGDVEWPPGISTRAAALPLSAVREFLFPHDTYQVPLLAEAARRRHCDWDRRIADLHNPLGITIPEVEESRSLARVESLRCRLAIAEARIDDALAVLRRQFMLARHLGQDEFAVGVLNGVAVASMATGDALKLVQLPAAPEPLLGRRGDAPAVHRCVTHAGDRAIDALTHHEIASRRR